MEYKDSMIPDPHSSQLHDPLHIHQHHPNEDFLDQILSTMPNCTWPPHPDDIPESGPVHGIKPSNGHGPGVERAVTAPTEGFQYPFDEMCNGNGNGNGNGFDGIQLINPQHHPFHPSSAPQNYGGVTAGAGAAPASASTGGSSGATPQKQSRVRARRGQATDPHSIAERLRRERIAERMKALQELVPNANKTDKASMLDEIIEYVKFLQLQVKVVSMSRLGGVAAMAPLVADMSSAGVGIRRGNNANQTPMVAPNNNKMAITENQVAKLMEEDMGSAMQYLQGKGLCLMPISLATAISTAACTSRNPPPPPSNPHLSSQGDGESDTVANNAPVSPNVAPITDVPINGAFKK